MNEEQLSKALKDLIDETIAEIEDLKKSDRFSASEIKIEGPGCGIGDKPVNGKLDAKKADEDDDDEDEKEDKEEIVEKEEDEVEKADEDDEDEDEEEKDKVVEKGVLDEAEEPAQNTAAKPYMKKSEEEAEDLKKSIAASEELMKSYVDTKIAPLEDKMSQILEAVQNLADTPVERKSVPAGIQPLTKSAFDEGESLSKGEVINKMLELKKNGESVPTDDITRVELGGPADLAMVVKKYKITRDEGESACLIISIKS